MTKGTIPTYFENVVKLAKNTPGVGKYEPEKKKRILGNYTYATVGGGFTDAAMYQGQQTPPHYQAIDLDKIKNRILSTKITPFKGDKDSQYKFKKNDSPSPHSYRNRDSYFNTQVHNVNYSIAKTKKSNFAE